MGVAFSYLFLVVVVGVYAAMLYGAWCGIARAGYHGAWALILLVPVVNIVMLYVFAFSRWPIEVRAPVAPGSWK
jgi:hypothetical protein